MHRHGRTCRRTRTSFCSQGTSCSATRSVAVAARCLKMPPALSPRRRPLRHQFGCRCFGGDSIEEDPVPQRAGSFHVVNAAASRRLESARGRARPNHFRTQWFRGRFKSGRTPMLRFDLGDRHRCSDHEPDHLRDRGKAGKQGATKAERCAGWTAGTMWPRPMARMDGPAPEARRCTTPASARPARPKKATAEPSAEIRMWLPGSGLEPPT
jgi:hypothetical protein